jgi:antitoxin YefM
VALIPVEERSGLMETPQLLCSPANAKRLLTALRRSERRKGKPSTLEQLRRDVGLGATK